MFERIVEAPRTANDTEKLSKGEEILLEAVLKELESIDKSLEGQARWDAITERMKEMSNVTPQPHGLIEELARVITIEKHNAKIQQERQELLTKYPLAAKASHDKK